MTSNLSGLALAVGPLPGAGAAEAGGDVRGAAFERLRAFEKSGLFIPLDDVWVR